MKWISKKLKLKVRRVFEPRYNRKLTDDEVIEIAENLTHLLEIILTNEIKDERIYSDQKPSDF